MVGLLLEITPRRGQGALGHPLIFQNLSAGIGTLALEKASLLLMAGLPRFQRAGPSTSLDKSTDI
jgi:hypothetical protein